MLIGAVIMSDLEEFETNDRRRTGSTVQESSRSIGYSPQDILASCSLCVAKEARRRLDKGLISITSIAAERGD